MQIIKDGQFEEDNYKFPQIRQGKSSGEFYIFLSGNNSGRHLNAPDKTTPFQNTDPVHGEIILRNTKETT